MKPLGSLSDPILFYDGECGVCHGVVRFTLSIDKAGVLKFAPLQGETLKSLLSSEEILKLPDSVVLYKPNDQAVSSRSDAVLDSIEILSGKNSIPILKGLGKFSRVVPRPIRDFFYSLFASIRKFLAPTPKNLCPILPEELRERFLP